MKKSIAQRGIVSVLALVVILVACSRPPEPGKVGDRLEFRGYAMTVTQVEMAKDFPSARAARAGNTLVAVEILVESNGANVQVSPAHMWVAEPSGKVYKPHATGRAPILQERANVPKSQRAQGWLTFEVPENAKDLRFVNELPKEFNYAKLRVNIN